MKEDYFLDTSIAIDYIRGKQEISFLINQLNCSFYINYIVVAELCEGIYRSDNPKKTENEIIEFVDGMGAILQINFEISRRFGKIRASLRKKGEIIEDMDMLIAATCIENGLPLLTLNKKHFEKIEGLEVHTPDEFLIQ